MLHKAEDYGRSRWVVLAITVVMAFMASLDSSIVNVALPHMAEELGVATGEIAWVVSSYLIVITVCILAFGRLGDLKGQSRIFRYGLLIFTLGSLLCGLTHTLPLLIGARVVQAVGAAAGMANSQGIITRTFPPEERGRALGINATAVALGSLTGPALGGLLISVAGWEYLFWLNVPVGLAAYFANLKFPGQPHGPSLEKLDLRGAGLFMLFIAPLFIALEYGQFIGYGRSLILAMFGLSLVAGTAFFLMEYKTPAPMLDLRIFKNKWYSISIFCAFASYVTISCSNIVLPFYLQNVLGLPPERAGLYMTIYPLVLALVAPVSGYLSDKFGSEVLTLIGLSLASGGLFLMGTLGEQPQYLIMGIYIGLMSLGNGLFQSPNTSLLMSLVPRDKLGIGGSVNALVRNMGFTLGIALSTAILYGGISAKLGYRVSDYVPGRNDAFVFGMRLTYITAAAIGLAGVLVTAFRLYQRRREKSAAGAGFSAHKS